MTVCGVISQHLLWMIDAGKNYKKVISVLRQSDFVFYAITNVYVLKEV